MDKVLERIGLARIVPVVVMSREDGAGKLAGALTRAGLAVAEVTFRTGAAERVIAGMASEEPEMLLGAGTVTTVDQVKAAVEAGAKFIVSPGLSRTVVEYCIKREIPVIPGVATPTDIMAALDLGLEVVKFFPAEAIGGLDYLRAITAPFPTMRFIPTGGIDESNLMSYLRHPRVFACGGSWMVKQDLIEGGRFEEITRLARGTVSLIKAG